MNLETSVERGFFSVKPPGYWREADFNARAASGRSYNTDNCGFQNEYQTAGNACLSIQRKRSGTDQGL
jgi:hypothetical protein